jgi:hypothetical protein
MNALTPRDFERDVARYERIYNQDNLSTRPRVESIMSAVTLAVCLGTIYALFSRYALFNPDAQWILLCFLGSFAWHLKDSAFCLVMIQDEAIYRFCHKRSWPFPHVFDAPRAQYIVRSLGLIFLFFFELLALAWFSSVIADYFFPIEHLRNVPFSGGG